MQIVPNAAAVLSPECQNCQGALNQIFITFKKSTQPQDWGIKLTAKTWLPYFQIALVCQQGNVKVLIHLLSNFNLLRVLFYLA